MNKFIYTILRILEKRNLFAFAYRGKDFQRDLFFIAIDNYSVYRYDKKFKNLVDNFRKIAVKKKMRIIFVFQKPQEKILKELNNQENLFIII